MNSKSYPEYSDQPGPQFPAFLLEETLALTEIPTEVKKQIKDCFSQGLLALKEQILDCQKKLNQRSHESKIARSKAYLLILGSLQKEHPFKEELLSYLGKKGLIKALHPHQLFALAIQAIRQGESDAFKKIVLAARKARMPEDLLRYQDTATQSHLAHMAAQMDRKDIIQYLVSLDRETLEQTNANQESIAHICARTGSPQTILFLLQTSKKIFGRKNKEGQTPLELEHGPAICKAIAIIAVEEDIAKGKETKEKAITACLQFKKNQTKKLPAPQIPQ